MEEHCRIEMLGRLRAVRPDRMLTRFETRQTAALLAYLAYYRRRHHGRDELVELLWPECDPRDGRHRLCQALYALRRQLEPPGVPAGSVLLADRHCIQVNSAQCSTDVAEFEAAILSAARAQTDGDRVRWLVEATDRYHGELLPGHFELWIVPQRQRLAAMFYQAVTQVSAHLERCGDLPGALQYTLRAADADPLHEGTRAGLIRLLPSAGVPQGAGGQGSPDGILPARR